MCPTRHSWFGELGSAFQDAEGRRELLVSLKTIGHTVSLLRGLDLLGGVPFPKLGDDRDSWNIFQDARISDVTPYVVGLVVAIFLVALF